jgi:hypothetical protein
MRRLKIFSRVQQYRDRKKRLRGIRRLINEINGNLESYYVMSQRDVRKPLLAPVWSGAGMAGAALPAPFLEYRVRVEQYNTLLTEFLEYQRWYSGDIGRQTRDHALVLEEKRDRVDQASRGLKPVMDAARDALEESAGDHAAKAAGI